MPVQDRAGNSGTESERTGSSGTLLARDVRQTFTIEEPPILFPEKAIALNPYPDEPGEPPVHLYVITSERRTKIGISTNPVKRCRQLQSASGIATFLFWSKAFAREYGARAAEREVHKRFRLHRGNGEWFNIRPEVAVAYADTMKDSSAPKPVAWHEAMPRELLKGPHLALWNWYLVRGLPFPAPYF